LILEDVDFETSDSTLSTVEIAAQVLVQWQPGLGSWPAVAKQVVIRIRPGKSSFRLVARRQIIELNRVIQAESIVN
jgi:hypothetical protein